MADCKVLSSIEKARESDIPEWVILDNASLADTHEGAENEKCLTTAAFSSLSVCASSMHSKHSRFLVLGSLSNVTVDDPRGAIDLSGMGLHMLCNAGSSIRLL